MSENTNIGKTTGKYGTPDLNPGQAPVNPFPPPATPVPPARTPTKPYKSLGTAYKWLFFLGVVGAHRFYMGKVGTGILWLCTLGLLGIGVLYDVLTLDKQVEDVNIEIEQRQQTLALATRGVPGS